MKQLKQLKFLTMALAMLLGVVTTSSCIDSDSTSVRTGVAIVKVANSMGSTYFRTADGKTIYPTSTSIAQLVANGADFTSMIGEIVYIWYQWDSDVVTITGDETSIEDVDVVYVAPMDSPVEIVESEGAVNDSIADTPVIALGAMSSSSSNGEMQAEFFDATTLLLPINYYINTSLHTFTLVYLPEDNTGENGFTLRLRHNKQQDNPTAGSTTAYAYYVAGYINIYVRSFDLSAAMARYRSSNNVDEVTTVRILASVDNYGVDLDGATEEEYIYTYSTSTD